MQFTIKGLLVRVCGLVEMHFPCYLMFYNIKYNIIVLSPKMEVFEDVLFFSKLPS